VVVDETYLAERGANQVEDGWGGRTKRGELKKVYDD
jgi:hypothetical protein